MPAPNPSGTTKITILGSYHGVPGTYSCTPASGGSCAVAVAGKGFNLSGLNSGGVAVDTKWTFSPTDPETRLMEVPDGIYASYGWWLHKAAGDGDFTASAFADYKGTAPTVGISMLRGKATYMGGAVGKYALSSSTGGTNNAGDFTADAMLKATFAEAHTISGTISNFTDADGETPDWTVEMKEAVITDNRGDFPLWCQRYGLDDRRDGRCSLRRVVRESP